MSFKKLAVISDQICNEIGGSESVLFNVIDMFPDASVYTTVYNPEMIPEKYKNINITPTFIQDLPFSKKIYKAYFPLMPLAIECLNLQEYDIVFSSHHCVAKGIIPRPDAFHVSYCHSPARYIWDLFWTYSDFNNLKILTKILVATISHNIRTWDVASSNRVDYFIANSNYTAARIKKFYNRDSEIIFPPVNTNNFAFEGEDDYYFMLGRLVAYKGFELAIRAFNESGKKLIIAGDGVEYQKLESIANSNIHMKGRISADEVKKYMNNCKGFVFSGKEDFGIVMAEAQSAGKPVIAFNGGGACDIVLNNETGILFNEQTINSLNNAINRSELNKWDHNFISNHAKKFDVSIFRSKLKFILNNIEQFKNKNSYLYSDKTLRNDSRNISILTQKVNEL